MPLRWNRSSEVIPLALSHAPVVWNYPLPQVAHTKRGPWGGADRLWLGLDAPPLSRFGGFGFDTLV